MTSATEHHADTEVGGSMRAISQAVLGDPDVLQVVSLPQPVPRVGEVLVRVHAAGVNPSDWKHRRLGLFLGEPPFVLGWDVSGVVVATGVGVSLHKPGDEVFGMLPYPFGSGAYAEYVTGPARAFAAKPAAIDHVHAAALPLAGLTAWQAVVDTARVEAGQRVLIHAAAGGVGHLAVQIAKALGAYVIGTASPANHDFVRAMGADEVIDYRTTDVTVAVRDVDVVLDSQGSDHASNSLRNLRPGGTLVSLRIDKGMSDLKALADELGVRAEVIVVQSDYAGMAAIADLVGSGRLRPQVGRTFALADAAAAHELGESGGTAGKLVLRCVE